MASLKGDPPQSQPGFGLEEPGLSVVSRIAHDSSMHSPSWMPTGPWWRNLESHFYRRPEGFELSVRDWVRVHATASSDVALRTLGALMIGSLAVPLGFHPLALKRTFDQHPFYKEILESGDPKRFFHDPPEGVAVKVLRARTPHFRTGTGQCVDLRFESPFVPVNPEVRAEYLSHGKNRVAHARYWRHDSGPRPTIVAIHGFFADLYLFNEWFFALPWFYKLGYDVMLFTLPFHGPRQPRLSPFSGHGLFAGGVGRLNEAFAQAVMDFRVFLRYLLDEVGVPQAGVTGISLGGYTTALLAAVEPRLAFAIPNVPVASIADLAFEWQPLGLAIRGALRGLGLSIRDARELLAVTCPLSYPPLVAKRRRMIIGGVGDRLAPPKHSRILWDHWGRCRIHWFPGNHVIHLDKGSYLKQMALFMRDIGFVPGAVSA